MKKQQSILKAEVALPYIAVIAFYTVLGQYMPESIYLILSVLLAFYFLPIRLLVKREEKKWFTVATSFLFANILIFSCLYQFNSRSQVIQNALGILGITCLTLMLYRFIFEKLDIKTFLLHFGFCILASLYL